MLHVNDTLSRTTPGVWLSCGHSLCKQLSKDASKVNCPLRDHHHHALKSRCVAKLVFPQSELQCSKGLGMCSTCEFLLEMLLPQCKIIKFWGHLSTNMKVKNIWKLTDQKITTIYDLKLWWFGVEWKQPISFLSLFALGDNQKFSEELICKEKLAMSLGLGRYNSVLPPFCISLLKYPY